jgi:hypothetical protein
MSTFVMFFMLCVVGVAVGNEAVRYREEEIFRGFAPDPKPVVKPGPCPLMDTLVRKAEDQKWYDHIDCIIDASLLVYQAIDDLDRRVDNAACERLCADPEALAEIVASFLDASHTMFLHLSRSYFTRSKKAAAKGKEYTHLFQKSREYLTLAAACS